MSAAPPVELVKPNSEEVITEPTTIKSIEDGVRKEVADQLNEMGEKVTVEAVTPPAESNSPPVKVEGVKIEVLGTEEPNFLGKEISHGVDIITQPLTGRSLWYRLTHPGDYWRKFAEMRKRKKQPPSAHDLTKTIMET